MHIRQPRFLINAVTKIALSVLHPQTKFSSADSLRFKSKMVATGLAGRFLVTLWGLRLSESYNSALKWLPLNLYVYADKAFSLSCEEHALLWNTEVIVHECDIFIFNHTVNCERRGGLGYYARLMIKNQTSQLSQELERWLTCTYHYLDFFGSIITHNTVLIIRDILSCKMNI